MQTIVDLDALKRLADRWVAEPISFSQTVPSPVVLGLCGTLGAGKTRLTQELCRAAGIDVANVTSPTFTLLQTHVAQNVTIHHLDAYRIADEDEFWELGVEELWQNPGSWTIVEWADRFRRAMPPQTIWVTIDFADDAGDEDSQRTLDLQTDDPQMRDWINRIVTPAPPP